MNKGNTNDLFAILGIAMKPNPYNNAHSQGQQQSDFANTEDVRGQGNVTEILGEKMGLNYTPTMEQIFGKGFHNEEPMSDDQYQNCIIIERQGAQAIFGELHPNGFIKVSFMKSNHETRAFRFNKSEIRIIANYFNELLEEE